MLLPRWGSPYVWVWWRGCWCYIAGCSASTVVGHGWLVQCSNKICNGASSAWCRLNDLPVWCRPDCKHRGTIYSHCRQAQVILDWLEETRDLLNGRQTELILCWPNALLTWLKNNPMYSRKATESALSLVIVTFTGWLKALQVCQSL
jgi:hypothetical protein